MLRSASLGARFTPRLCQSRADWRRASSLTGSNWRSTRICSIVSGVVNHICLLLCWFNLPGLVPIPHKDKSTPIVGMRPARMLLNLCHRLSECQGFVCFCLPCSVECLHERGGGWVIDLPEADQQGADPCL